MKYREEFEAWFRQKYVNQRFRYNREKLLDFIDGEYAFHEVNAVYSTFSAGYEAALKKGRDDGIV